MFAIRPATIPLSAFATTVALLAAAAPAARAEGEDIGAMADKSLAAMNVGRWEEALTLLDSIVKRYAQNAKTLFGPKFGVLYYRKGICEMKLRKWDEAMKSFELCYRDFPNGGDAAQTGGGNVFHSKSLLKWGEAAMGAEDWNLAIRQFKRYLAEKDKAESYPRGALQINLAICNYRLGKIADGNSYLETAIKNKYTPGWDVPDAGVAAGFQGLVAGVIEKSQQQALLDFITKNRADITLEPFEMGSFNKLYMKLAADAIEAGMDPSAMQLYQLIPPAELEAEGLKIRIGDLSFRPGVKDGSRLIRTADLKKELAQLDTERSTGKSPDITRLAATAYIHEKAGNARGAYAAYEQLETLYPKASKREDYLFHLVRTSALIGEVMKTEEFGQLFLKTFPDSKRVPEVRRMLLSSLFYEGRFDICIEVASAMIGAMEKGTPGHDICLHVLGGSYYYTGAFEKAQPLLDEEVKLYPESQFAQAALYFQASNRSKLQEWSEAGKLLDAFLAKYPDPKANPYYSFALFDRANCNYSVGENDAAVTLLDRLDSEFPNAEITDLALNLRGNVLQTLKKPEPAEKSYLAALKLAETRQNAAVAAESLYYLVGLLGEKSKDPKSPNPRIKEAVPYADRFWKQYATASPALKPRMAVAQVAALDSAGRVDEALSRLEGVIAEMAQGENTTDLEAAINSYSDAFLDKDRHTPEQLKERFYDFPGIKATNRGARAILRMGVITVFEEIAKKAKDDDPGKGKAQAMVKVLFQQLKSDFNPKDLTNYILVRVGDYIRTRTSTPREALPFYNEVIQPESPRNDKSNLFKALIGRGGINCASSETADLDSAIADFARVLADSTDKAEREEALFGTITALMAKKDYAKAAEACKAYFEPGTGFTKRKAEVAMMFAKSYEERQEINDAIAVYGMVWTTYGGRVGIACPALKSWMEMLWRRNLPARTAPDGKYSLADRQEAYDGGAKYIENTSRGDFQSKMSPEEKLLWDSVRDLVKSYESDPAIKSLAVQRKEAEAGTRRR